MSYWDAPYPRRGVIRDSVTTSGGIILPRDAPKVVVPVIAPTEPPPPPVVEKPAVECPELERYDWIKALAKRCNWTVLPLDECRVAAESSGSARGAPQQVFKTMAIYFEPVDGCYISDMKVGNRSQMVGWGDPGMPLAVFKSGPIVLQFNTAELGILISFYIINKSLEEQHVTGFLLGMVPPDKPMMYYNHVNP